MSVEITVPQLGESIVEATVGRWLKAQGDAVAEGEPVVELETDKVNMEVAAAGSGVLAAIVRGEGETVNIGDVLGTLDNLAAQSSSETTSTEAAAAPLQGQEAPEPSKQESRVAQAPPQGRAVEGNGTTESGRSTPLARRAAAELGVDLGAIVGTGPSGRVTKEDVAAYTQSTAKGAPVAQPQVAPTKTPLSVSASAPVDTARSEERVHMSRRRQTIARRLVDAQHTAAMLTTFNEVDMSAILGVRKERRDTFKERHGVNLGFMSFFTRAVIGSLKAFPRLNAEIQGDDMILKNYYDIGIAVGADEGLVVPVLRDADRMSFAEIERSIADLATRARNGTLGLTDLQGGTFTITNGGIFGSLLSTPILNAPQVGILGMHKIEERPIAVKGEVLIRPMMYLAMSYDHRIVDGNEAVRFLVSVKSMLEDPLTMLLEG